MTLDTPTGQLPVHVLIADDEAIVRDLLRDTITREGHTCLTAADGQEALRVLRSIRVDVVITDIEMPGLDGLELLRQAKAAYDVEVIVMTAYANRYTYDRIVEQRATDFALKMPNFHREMVVRLRKALRERAIRKERDRVHAELQHAHHELKIAYLDTVNRLVRAAEHKDYGETAGHVTRIQRYCHLLAERYGARHELGPGFAEQIRNAAPMHDIGKIGIQRTMLTKPGRLTPEEFEVMKSHTRIGAEILDGAPGEVLQLGRTIALTHHERWDGTGYPDGLLGDEIPLAGRIVGVVDVFDALRSPRPYKDAYPLEVTLELMRRERGRHFDPEVLDAFFEGIDDVLRIEGEAGSPEDPGAFELSARDREGDPGA